MSEFSSDLTSLERDLVDAAASGAVLQCKWTTRDKLATSGDPAHIIRGEAIRELLLNDCKPLDSRGIRLHGARITGTLDLRHVHARVGIELDGCTVDRPLLLEYARLPWLTLFATSTSALLGDGLQVDGDLVLRLMQATYENLCSEYRGVMYSGVQLARAHISGQLNLMGAKLTGLDGPALAGDGLRVDGDLIMDGLEATGCGGLGAVRLVGARIGGELNLKWARLTSQRVRIMGRQDQGLVLNLQEAEAKRVYLPSDVICSDQLAGWSMCRTTMRRIDLSGFVYARLEPDDWRQWLHLIIRHTSRYWPQPYQQLVEGCRAAGDEAGARQVSIAWQDDRWKRGEFGGKLTITGHRLWGCLAGYGYRTRRIVVALLLVLFVAGGLGVVAGHTPTGAGHYVAMRTLRTDTPYAACSLLEQVGVGIDRGLPLSTTGIRDRCDFDTASRPGQIITAVSWILQALVWALATLVIAGYTGLIRKVM